MPSRKINQAGRNKYVPHCRIDHRMMKSAAWRDLSGAAVKLLLLLAMMENGQNNGLFFLSVRDAAERLGISKNTAASAFKDLQEHGFIAAEEKGHFDRKSPHATTWRLTWRPLPGRAAATNEWDYWKQTPEQNKSRSQKLTTTVSKIGTDDEISPVTVSKIGTDIPAMPQKRVKWTVPNIGTQTVTSSCGEHEPDADAIKGGKAASGLRNDDDAADITSLLHGYLSEFWSKASRSKRDALATSIGVNASDLKSVIGGTFQLSAPKQAALLNQFVKGQMQ